MNFTQTDPLPNTYWSRKADNVKSAMLMVWWPKLAEYIKNGKPGDSWEIPFQWNLKELRNVRADKGGK